MSENFQVEIVDLPELLAATTIGFGEGPEGQAWDRMLAWVKQSSLWQDGYPHRMFGADTSSPSAASPNYGYQVWYTLAQVIDTPAEIEICRIPAGQYAVIRLNVTSPWDDIPGGWKKLMAWVETSPYHMDRRPCYEESFWTDQPDYSHFRLDLYLPITRG
jgi:DNA gyrase inhibitor GyrI